MNTLFNTALKALKENHKEVGDNRIDTKKFRSHSHAGHNFLIDYSKTNIDTDARALLFWALDACNFNKRRKDLENGNVMELHNNKALHGVVRQEMSAVFNEPSDGDSVFTLELKENKGKMIRISENIGKIKDVIHIGIGGSMLGSKLIVEALKPYHVKNAPKIHFVSSVDSSQLADALQNAKPETTLFIIVSKSFKTPETMANAESAFAWAGKKTDNFIAITGDPEKAREFGIPRKRILTIQKELNGRFSVWGSVGLSAMIAIGEENYKDLVFGALNADEEFYKDPVEKNIPVLLAVVGFWHRVVCGYTSRAIIPYASRLAGLVPYVQQVDMESNGKYSPRSTAPVVFGAVGSDAQHSFFQALHQGTDIIPAEFWLEKGGDDEHSLLLQANCLAQSKSLMTGSVSRYTINLKSTSKTCYGNRPSITILHDKLTPSVLGGIMSIMENRAFVEGMLYGVNSFDQWGVEVAKPLAAEIADIMRSNSIMNTQDHSTQGLVKGLRSKHGF